MSTEWTTLVSTTIGYTDVTPLIPGTFYTFKILALNKYGSGIVSPTVRIIAGQRPDPDDAAPTVMYNGVYLQVNWNAAIPNHVDVDAYSIQIRTQDPAIFAEQRVNCDGSKDPVLT